MFACAFGVWLVLVGCMYLGVGEFVDFWLVGIGLYLVLAVSGGLCLVFGCWWLLSLDLVDSCGCWQFVCAACCRLVLVGFRVWLVCVVVLL